MATGLAFAAFAGPRVAAPRHSVLLDRLEVVLIEVVGDLVAEHRSLRVCGAEVDAAPHSGVDDFLERVREPLKAPRSTGFVAEGTERDLVGVEEVLECVNDCTAYTAMARGMFGEGRRDEQRRVADRCCYVKQRPPCRVSLGCRVAIGVGFADRCDRTRSRRPGLDYRNRVLGGMRHVRQEKRSDARATFEV